MLASSNFSSSISRSYEHQYDADDPAPRAVVLLHRHGDRSPIHNAYRHSDAADAEADTWEDRLALHVEAVHLDQVCFSSSKV